ncbi:MAG: YbhB/YbcL family Raf kinase inhibitor-like protein [Burkholderiaceae bacterium]
MLENLPDFVGHALREQRAGIDQIAFRRLPLRGGQGAIAVTSLAFVDHGPLLAAYTADGEGRSPPLQWHGVPPAAQSLVLIVEDADSPTPHPLVHAIMVGLAPQDGALGEHAMEDDADAPDDARLGRNSGLRRGWLPPDPPPGHGPHRYAFQVFALGAGAELPAAPGRDALMDALAESAIASGLLIGTYERHDTSVKSSEAEGSSSQATAGAAFG